MAATVHIPAWKKLGLKLKYANDTPAIPVTSIDIGPAVNGVNSKKRKTPPRNEEESSVVAVSRSTKKAKTSRQLPDDSVNYIPQSTVPLVSPTITHEPEAVPASSPSSTKRKSVSFTPETKTVDGEGAKKLYTAWLAQQADDFDPTTAAQALRHITPPQIIPTEPNEITSTSTPSKAEKLKTSKPKKASQPALKEESSTTPILLTLRYLQAYHESRSTWKFNKSKQNQILKHAFNTSKIPPDHDDALKAYVTGLESSAAKKRLRDEAMAIRNEDTDTDQDTSTSTSRDTASPASPSGPSPSLAPTDPSAGKAARHAAKAAKRAAEPLPKQHYRQALHRYKQQLRGLEFEREEREKLLDPAWRLRLLKRKRAELVLWSVGTEEEALATTVAQMTGQRPGEGGVAALLRPGEVLTGVVEEEEDAGAGKRRRGEGPVKRRRKRKRRTGVPDDDSSSEESSSSEGTSSGVGEVVERGKEKMEWLNLEGEGHLLTDEGSGGSTEEESSSEEGSSEEGSGSEGWSDSGSDSGSGGIIPLRHPSGSSGSSGDSGSESESESKSGGGSESESESGSGRQSSSDES